MSSNFVVLSKNNIIERINAAQHSIFIAIPGLDVELIHALKVAVDRLGGKYVEVVVDGSDNACRLGYGSIKDLEVLVTSEILIKQQKGLRVGVLIADDSGWCFTQPSLLVESDPEVGCNAIWLVDDQVKQLRVQCLTLVNEEDTPKLEISEEKIVQVEFSEKYTKETLDSVKKSIDEAPPVNFEHARKVNVFSSYIEFVDLKLSGCNLDRKVLRFTKEMKSYLSDNEDIQNRLSASYKLVDKENDLSTGEVTSAVESIRNNFLKPLGGNLGNAILISKKDAFDKEISKIRELIEQVTEKLYEELEKELQQTVETLSTVLCRTVLENPPLKLKNECNGPVTEGIAQKYVKCQLFAAVPPPHQILNKISLDLTYKAVTYEMLNDDSFQKQVRKVFPYVDWERPFEAFDAIDTRK